MRSRLAFRSVWRAECELVQRERCA
jgi:hypothetical protein